MMKDSCVIKGKEGLHARPATLFVSLANSFKSNIKVIKNDDELKEYAGKSILSIMSMAAAEGDKLTIFAEGEDEALAVEKLVELIDRNFEGV